MAYDEALAERVLAALGMIPDLEAKKMFGGVGYMVQGNMACGVHGPRLIVRVGPVKYHEALSASVARPFDLTGQPMKGWVYIEPEGVEAQADLEDWVQRGVQFALSLPAK